LGLRTHNVHAHEVRGQYFVDLHVEVPPDLTLQEAHGLASQLEDALREELSYVAEVHTHIEPIAVSVAQAALAPGEDERLRAQIVEVVHSVPGLYDCHKLHIRPAPDGYDVVLHCLADASLPVAEAHRLADLAEKQLYVQVPEVGQVLIHVEPEREA
jgi:divalent metal cation (Fe/Co/Zn/Cd) transporter